MIKTGRHHCTKEHRHLTLHLLRNTDTTATASTARFAFNCIDWASWFSLAERTCECSVATTGFTEFGQGNSKKQIWNYLVGKLICTKEAIAVINTKSWKLPAQRKSKRHIPHYEIQRGLIAWQSTHTMVNVCLDWYHMSKTNTLLRCLFWKDWRYLQQSFVGYRLLWMIGADIYKTSGRSHPVELNTHVILTAARGVMLYSRRTGCSYWHFITHKPWYQEKVYLKIYLFTVSTTDLNYTI